MSVLILWVPQLNNIRALVNIQILPCLGHYQGDWAKENVWVMWMAVVDKGGRLLLRCYFAFEEGLT